MFLQQSVRSNEAEMLCIVYYLHSQKWTKKNQCEESHKKMNKASALLSPLKANSFVSQRADDQALLPLFISSEAKWAPGQDTRTEESRMGTEVTVLEMGELFDM